MNEFEHLKIQLEEIRKATSNFSGSSIIGRGGFGNVFKGEVSHLKGRGMVAIKRLDRKFGQGDPEFWKEIMMLTRYTHKNIISLLGFCDEDDEKILIYEHASNGSLDRHLSSTFLTWTQRIKICLDAAKGLSYLHDHKKTQQRILHRDIKSANILLDDIWNAKISDMGLSKLGPANQPHSLIFTQVVGTPGYCDPQYMKTYALTKESDVYSLGVVFFEVLCGRLCFELDGNRELRIFVPTWKEGYKHKKLDKIIFKDLKIPMDKTSFETFVDIAFQCVQEAREQQPKISLVVKKLETALKFQERYEMKISETEVIKAMETRPKQGYLEDLFFDGKRFFLNLGKPKRINKQNEQPPKLPSQKKASASSSGVGTSIESESNKLVFLNSEIYSFDLEDLLRLSAEVMGRGSVGKSLKVKLMDSSMTLVVKLLKDVSATKKEFESRMEVLRKMKNENLISLRGFYYSKFEKFLVHDYLPACSLFDRLHGYRGPGRTPLDWGHRLKIVLSAARGVAYLHEVGNLVHGNIKSSNILLQEEDKKMHALVCDFGLNTLLCTDRQVLGYAPDVLEYQNLSFKSDVYSFGVLLLELLTGKDPKDQALSGEDLPQWIRDTVREEWGADVFDDEILRHEYIREEMIYLLQLAKNCVSISPDQRPTMNEVVREIEDMNQS